MKDKRFFYWLVPAILIFILYWINIFNRYSQEFTVIIPALDFRYSISFDFWLNLAISLMFLISSFKELIKDYEDKALFIVKFGLLLMAVNLVTVRFGWHRWPGQDNLFKVIVLHYDGFYHYVLTAAVVCQAVGLGYFFALPIKKGFFDFVTLFMLLFTLFYVNFIFAGVFTLVALALTLPLYYAGLVLRRYRVKRFGVSRKSRLRQLKRRAWLKSRFWRFRFPLAPCLPPAADKTTTDLFTKPEEVRDGLAWRCLSAELAKNPGRKGEQIYRHRVKIGQWEYALVYFGGYNKINYLAAIEGVAVSNEFREALSKFELYLFLESACQPQMTTVHFVEEADTSRIVRQTERCVFYAFPWLFPAAWIVESSNIERLPDWYFFCFRDRDGQLRQVGKKYLLGRHDALYQRQMADFHHFDN